MTKCNICDIEFPDIAHFTNHFKITHKGEFEWAGTSPIVEYKNFSIIPVSSGGITINTSTEIEIHAPAEKEITEVTDELRELLLAKNKKYGNSAIEPIRIFSKCDSSEQIRVRIDDKLSRIVSGQSDEDEDVLDDLLGYLVLLKIALKKEHSESK